MEHAFLLSLIEKLKEQNPFHIDCEGPQVMYNMVCITCRWSELKRRPDRQGREHRVTIAVHDAYVRVWHIFERLSASDAPERLAQPIGALEDPATFDRLSVAAAEWGLRLSWRTIHA